MQFSNVRTSAHDRASRPYFTSRGGKQMPDCFCCDTVWPEKKPQDFKITTYSSRNLATDATLAWTCEEASPVQTSSYEKSETKSYCRAPWCVLLVLPSYPSYPTLAAATVQSELSRISRWRICIQSGLLGNTP